MICTPTNASFESIIDTWHGLLARRLWTSIFLTPEWQSTWWNRFDDGTAELKLVTVGPSDAPLGLAPLSLSGSTLTFVGDTDLFDYHDFIDVVPGFHEALVECLEDEPWQTMDLRSVPAFSPAVEALPAALRAIGCEVTIEEEDVVPGVELPATWDEFLANLRKKDRHELRRKLRRLGGAGDVRVVEADGNALEKDFEVFHELMAESREEKRDFMLPEREEFFRSIIEWAHSADFLRLQFLELNGEKVAAVLSFDYDGRRLLYNSGFRLEHGQLAVGLMLKALCIKDAIERGLTYFDFLRGAEPYKYHLGGKDTRLVRIVATR